MKNKNEIVVDDELIAKYLSGDAMPEEAEALLDWLGEPKNEAHFEKIKATWDATFPSKRTVSFNKHSAWQTFQQQTASATKTATSVWYRIAATLIIGLSISFIGYYLYQSADKPGNLVVVNTKKMQKMITLPDSSAVVINRNSLITYQKGFGNESREVNFSGEGFFSVEKDASKPFIIHTSEANIKVVGTEFNVRSIGGVLEVNVQEGKVLVYTAVDSVFLDAGHSASVQAGKPINVINSINANQWGYASRKFVFQDVPLAEVFESIEKAYPYSIEVGNNDIKNCRLTAAFDHVSAREMLNLIGETLDLTIEQNDSTFRVEGKGCPWVQ